MMRALLLHASPTLGLRLRLALEQAGMAVTLCRTAAELPVGEPADLLVVDSGFLRQEEAGLRLDDLARRGGALLLLAGRGEALPAGMGGIAVLPADTPPEEVARQARPLACGAAAETGKTGERLLLVDDSVTYRQYLSLEMRDDGYQVEGVGEAGQALTALAAADYDCVITDLMLPDFNGLELARRLQRLRSERGVFFGIVILTSREDKAEMMRGLEAGADDFVGKSDDLGILRARLRALLRRKRLGEAAARKAAKGAV